MRHIGSGPQGTFELLGQLTVDAQRLSASLRLAKAPARRPWFAPRIEHFALGPWSEQAERVYAGCGNVIERPKAFRLAFDGHRLSTSFVGFDFPGGMALVQAVDRGPEALDVDPNSRLHGIYSDDYLATEVLTGHPAMVSQPFGPDVVRVYWLTHDLMRALAGRTIEAVQFVGGNLHRQRVDWSGGGQVWVNRGPDDWQVAGQTLPQYGFYARAPTDGGTVTASVSRREGLIVEQARGPREIYCNGRGGSGRNSAAATVDEAEFRARQNEADKLVDFGPVVTAGGCRLTRDGDDGLLVTPLPLPTEESA